MTNKIDNESFRWSSGVLHFYKNNICELGKQNIQTSMYLERIFLRAAPFRELLLNSICL